MPPWPGGTGNDLDAQCDMWDAIIDAATLSNPCFNVYLISTTCPLMWDVLGFPGTKQYLQQGAEIYFDRADIKAAINAPQIPWSEASPRNSYNTSDGESTNFDNNQLTGLPVLPSVIERSNRTVIGHAGLDIILLRNGTLLTIQNMTWSGQQGFQRRIEEDFFVPYHSDIQSATMAGAGIMGKTHTERGLTYFGTDLSGHMTPQFAPATPYRSLECLLGRIPSLTTTQPFSTTNDGLAAESTATQY